MRERAGGRSSIGALASVYYMVKVLLAPVRRAVPQATSTPLEDANDAAHRLHRRRVASVLLLARRASS